MKTRMRHRITSLLAGLCIAGPAVARTPMSQTPPQAKPLLLISNKGQIADQYGKPRKDIDYKIEGQGVNIYIGDGQLHYQWSKEHRERETEHGRAETAYIETYRMDVALEGANPQARVTEAETVPELRHYYLPQCPNGATAGACKRITYHDVYPGIDWVLYTNGQGLKYDFVVHKGADARLIKLRYDGATKLTLQDGAMTAETPMGRVQEQPPYTYDAATGQALASAYVLEGKRMGFAIKGGSGRGYVIDPVLVWAPTMAAIMQRPSAA